ncbi:MAG: MarR family transcriptional regulator [Planctomycetes bacterium]|nr:MarR family transcriptional regulator [Planctomycetota bacterium]
MNKLEDAAVDDLGQVTELLDSDLDTMVVYNILRTAAQLGPMVDAGLREARLTAAQMNALLVLRHGGEKGLLMGEMGRRLVVSKSNVTGLVDRLERQGLAQRVESPDRRATLVRLTAAGAGLLSRAEPVLAASSSAIAGGLSESEKSQLALLLTKLRRLLRHARAERG